MTEIRFVSLTCPNCGGSMQVGSDTAAGRLNCPYCGKACLVERGGDTISLRPLAEELKGTREASERVAAELAVRRLNEEIPVLQARVTAWDQAHPEPARGNMDMLALLVAVVGVLILLVGLISLVASPDNAGPLEVIGLVGLSLILVGIGLYVVLRRREGAAVRQRVSEWEKQAKDERAPLAKQVADAERELQRNRAIMETR